MIKHFIIQSNLKTTYIECTTIFSDTNFASHDKITELKFYSINEMKGKDMPIEENIFYVRLSELIRLSGKSFNEVERELHYPRNALHNYRTKRSPSADRLIELATYFEVSPEYLIGMNRKVGEKFQKSIKTIFNGLDEDQRKEMFKCCQEWVLESF